MPKEHILIVDDEEDILELVRFNLAKEGYLVDCMVSGEKALISLKTNALPDLIILDLMLPGMDGLDVCRLLKQSSKTASIPVIMLTAKGEDADIVAGLEMGADDYVTKPFSPRILLARIKAVLRRKRRSEQPVSPVIRIHGIQIDLERHEVLVEGNPVELTATEFDLLVLFARKPGMVFTRSKIIDSIKGHDYPVTDRSVDVQIVGLRKKLGTLGPLIETIRGVGYRFKE